MMLLVVIAWFFAYDGSESKALFDTCEDAYQNAPPNTRFTVCIPYTEYRT